MRNKVIFILLSILGIIILQSCSQKIEKDSTIQKDTSVESYLRNIEMKLGEYENGIDEIKKKAREKNLEKSAHFTQELEVFINQEKELKERLEGFKNKTGLSLDEIKLEMDDKLKELESSYQSLQSHFQ